MQTAKIRRTKNIVKKNVGTKSWNLRKNRD
jgi:hypothetical protein